MGVSNSTNSHILGNKPKRYVPSIKQFMTLCEGNYANLLKLLPQIEPVGFHSQFFVNDGLTYQLTIKECSKYTTLVACEQLQNGLPEYLRPHMDVRLYHDARLAEVISSQNISRIKPSYDYPNEKMHQQNEKFLTNQFLKEWVQFCLNSGRVNIAVNF
ncbi:DUF1249 domain-containing protein [Flocculibacter collagenilyticus]|uniref:DUF1249 domain-containing protein n=1 Tax=Flocculibacter collagenilyticus TaxID=2744479 RepID=UPI0018F753BC|nr:DUF1249 domain-containing protein [Flocculibacter collagenilyticus]